MRWIAFLPLALGACDAQVDGRYPGETLAILPGTVASPGDVVVEGMEIDWQTLDPRGPGATTTPLPVRTLFPSGFEASLVAPPPDVARFGFQGEPVFAEGYLFALSRRQGVLVPAGTDFGHALVWLSDPVGPETTTAAYLGGSLGAGFHVMRWTATEIPSPAQEILVGLCQAGARELGWSDTEAAITCRAIHCYQLAEDPAGMQTLWSMHVLGGPR